jgi:hypothetical protein
MLIWKFHNFNKNFKNWKTVQSPWVGLWQPKSTILVIRLWAPNVDLEAQNPLLVCTTHLASHLIYPMTFSLFIQCTSFPIKLVPKALHVLVCGPLDCYPFVMVVSAVIMHVKQSLDLKILVVITLRCMYSLTTHFFYLQKAGVHFLSLYADMSSQNHFGLQIVWVHS